MGEVSELVISTPQITMNIVLIYQIVDTMVIMKIAVTAYQLVTVLSR